MQLKDKSLNLNSQFKPTIIKLNTLTKDKKKLLKLRLPKESYLKLNYLITTELCVDQIKLYQQKKLEENNLNIEDIQSKYNINEDNKPKIIKNNLNIIKNDDIFNTGSRNVSISNNNMSNNNSTINNSKDIKLNNIN